MMPVAVFVVVVAALLAIPTMAADIQISELTLPGPQADAPRAPFVAEGDESWHEGPPIWTGQSKDVAAKFWMAGTATEFLFRIVVTDPRQDNPYHERDLWRGDCLYLDLDARHDDTPDELKNGVYGPDDARFIFALGANGPEGRVAKHGNPAEAVLEQTALIRKLVRDEAAKTTTYDLAIPYAKLATALGQSPSLGVGLCIAHKNSEGQDLLWGEPGASRQLHTIALASGKEPLVTVAPRRLRLTAPDASAEVTVAVRLPQEDTLTVQHGGQTQTRAVPGDNTLHRYLVRVPGREIAPAAAELVITPASKQSKMCATFRMITPAVLMHQFAGRIAALQSAAPAGEGLIREHLDSTLRLVQDAYDRLPLENANHPARAEEFLNKVELIASKLPAGRDDLDEHVNRGLPLVMAFVSEADRTLQFYALQLPFAYDPAKTYPLTVYLHGYGDQNPLGGLSTAFDNSGQDTLFRTALIDPRNIPPSHRGFVLAPWARGNSFYRAYGEADVYQTMDLVTKRFKIDPDRVYLTGFSMGCSGTMAIAGRQPDLFAGVNLASGFGPWSDTKLDYLAENLRGVGMALWIGELDGMLQDARAFDQLLTEKKIDHLFEVRPRTPHTYPYDQFQKNVGYLMQFTRARPGAFAFTTDTPEHPGRNGIVMNVPRFVPDSQRPTFSCRIDGQTVTLTSAHTSGLAVDLPLLGLSGEVKVIWNGQPAYSGEAQPIALGNAPSPRSRR